MKSKNPINFSKKVYEVCKQIPKGKVSTYKQIANKLNSKSYRAVGSALNKNPYAPIVPCHRVINSNGNIGGFASGTKNKIKMLEKKAITKAGHKAIMQIAIDVAASEFYKLDRYGGKHAAEYQMLYKKLVNTHNIFSIEDPFDQDDFEQWKAITERLGDKIQIVGDDLTVSNPERITTAIRGKLCNALLLKVNQIGTLTEAIQSANLAKGAGWKVMVSHRSGETEDTLIADLAFLTNSKACAGVIISSTPLNILYLLLFLGTFNPLNFLGNDSELSKSKLTRINFLIVWI